MGGKDALSKENRSNDGSYVDETKEYYQQRAKQYFDWAHDTGEYEGGSRPDESVYSEGMRVIQALRLFEMTGDVLEIACGTGVLTEELAKSARSVTALDSSRAMLERCERRLGRNPRVTYVVADAYEWVPDRAYDGVAFSFWISHVPRSRLGGFAAQVSRCLRPGGKLFFADQRQEAAKWERLESPGGEIARRSLGSGREFRVVKNFYGAEELAAAFLEEGIKTEVTLTPTHFYFVRGWKESGRTG